MPKSKRNKLVTLSKVKKKTKAWKEGTITTVRKAIDEYPSIYVLRYQNMRNDKFKELREELKDTSKFIFGSTKVMKVALGQDEAQEYQDGLTRVAEVLKGTVGLLFTRLPREEVMELFEKWEAVDFARAGSKATQDFSLQMGPLESPEGPLPHTVEPFLRQHKLPVKLNRGVVEIITDHTVCKAGQRLTPDQAAILRVFHVRMSSFCFKPIAHWEKEGGNFELLAGDESESEDEPEFEAEDDFGGVKVPTLPAGIVLRDS